MTFKRGWLRMVLAASLVCSAQMTRCFAEEAKKESKAAEQPKKEAKPSEEKATADAALKQQLAETFRKLDEMDKKWQQEKGKSSARAEASKDESGTKDDKQQAEARKKAKQAAEDDEKALKKARAREEKLAEQERRSSDSDGRRLRVNYGSYSVPEGGWVEVGGLTSSSSSSSSAGWGGNREGSSRSSSVSIRATVIRLDGPDE